MTLCGWRRRNNKDGNHRISKSLPHHLETSDSSLRVNTDKLGESQSMYIYYIIKSYRVPCTIKIGLQ